MHNTFQSFLFNLQERATPNPLTQFYKFASKLNSRAGLERWTRSRISIKKISANHSHCISLCSVKPNHFCAAAAVFSAAVVGSFLHRDTEAIHHHLLTPMASLVLSVQYWGLKLRFGLAVLAGIVTLRHSSYAPNQLRFPCRIPVSGLPQLSSTANMGVDKRQVSTFCQDRLID